MTSRRAVARRVALAATAVIGSLSLMLSGTHVAEPTEAAWTDSEVGDATVKARWMEGYARVTNPGWATENNRLPNRGGDWPSPTTQIREFVTSTPTAGNVASDLDRRTSRDFASPDGLRYGVDTSIVPSGSDRIRMAYDGTGTNYNGTASARHCLSFPDRTELVLPGSTSTAGASTDCHVTDRAARIEANQYTDQFTLRMQNSDTNAKNARLYANGFSSRVRCFSDGTTSAAVNWEDWSTLSLSAEAGSAPTVDLKPLIRAAVDDPGRKFDGTSNQWLRYAPHGATRNSAVYMVNARKNTYQTEFYALAELELVIQLYASTGNSQDAGPWLDQFNIPITRSECGFSNGTKPLQTPVGAHRGTSQQLGWPARVLGNTATAHSAGQDWSYIQSYTPSTGTAPAEPASRMALRSAPRPDATATTTLTSTPPATTVTSPLESATGTVTTASAQPEPGESDGPAAPTSTATEAPSATGATDTVTTVPATETATSPAPVVPTEPADLGAKEPTRIAGNVNVTEGESSTLTDALVKGDELPADANDGARALDTWLATGIERGDWKVFTSDDPDADGWRWATINQETGTVVYLR